MKIEHELIVAYGVGSVSPLTMLPRATAKMHLKGDGAWFMANRFKTRREVYGRCDRPADTIGGEWNHLIATGNTLQWTELPVGWFSR